MLNAASRPYLTVTQPMEMRQAAPRAMAPRILPEPPVEPETIKPVAEEPARKTEEPVTPSAATDAPKTPGTGAVNAPIVTPSVLTPEPPLELMPNGTPGLRPAMLEDFLPYFLPPGAPQSRATYEQK